MALPLAQPASAGIKRVGGQRTAMTGAYVAGSGALHGRRIPGQESGGGRGRRQGAVVYVARTSAKGINRSF